MLNPAILVLVIMQKMSYRNAALEPWPIATMDLLTPSYTCEFSRCDHHDNWAIFTSSPLFLKRSMNTYGFPTLQEWLFSPQLKDLGERGSERDADFSQEPRKLTHSSIVQQCLLFIFFIWKMHLSCPQRMQHSLIKVATSQAGPLWGHQASCIFLIHLQMDRS